MPYSYSYSVSVVRAHRDARPRGWQLTADLFKLSEKSLALMFSAHQNQWNCFKKMVKRLDGIGPSSRHWQNSRSMRAYMMLSCKVLNKCLVLTKGNGWSIL